MTPAEAEHLIATLPDNARLALLAAPFDRQLILDVAQPSRDHKPRGLWYACGTEWLDWVLGEMPDWLESEHLAYKLDVDLARMAVIRTVGELRAFHRRWSVGRNINWGAVAEEYDGIEICPYLSQARYDDEIAWYYTWDVASGAIWRAQAIERATLVYVDEGTRERMDRLGVKL